MTRPRRAGVAVAALGAALAALVIGPAADVPGSAAVAADPPLQVVGDARYVVEPDHSRVRVSVALVVRNTRGETTTRRYWYDRAYLAVQPTATTPRVSGTGAAPSVRVARSAKDHRLLEIRLGRRLYSGQSTQLRLTFQLRDHGGAPERPIRIGPGLVSFPVWAFASDATGGAKASVVIPPGYQVQYGAGAFAESERLADGSIRLATGPLADATRLRAYPVATGDAAFTEAKLSVPTAGGPLAVTVAGWTDDAAWRRRMAGLVADAATAVAADTGLPGPGAGLRIEEATSWALGGGAVVWDPSIGRLLVAHDARPPAVIRGVAQSFLSADVIAERWAVEGLAEAYAQRAAASLGIDFNVPAWSDKVGRTAGPLNAWPGPSEEPSALDAAVRATSAELARQLLERAGDERLRAALGRLGAGESVYQPASGSPDEAESAAGPADWRRILDALEADGIEVTDLWSGFVVRPEERSLLEDREAARARYRTIATTAAGWALPAAIREALTNWRFDTAQALMDGIDVAIVRRAVVEETAAGLGLDPPDTVQPLFERGRLDAAVAEADAEMAAMAAIADATTASATDGPLATIGLLGEEPAADLEAARSAFEAGRLEEAMAAADTARAIWLEADEIGSSRIAGLVVVVGAIGVMLLVARARWARTRTPTRRRIDEMARR
jgi:hypothetical protein